MPKGILGKKLGMTRVFDENGAAIPVTVIEAGPCPVVDKKTVQKNGYSALQIGFGELKESRVNKPMRGHFKKAGVKPTRYLREIKIVDDDPMAQFKVGQEIKADVFASGDYVDVIGTSKGKGFAGVVKRYGFNRGPMGHGSMYHRRPGSLGATAPNRVFKGRRLPGRLGAERVTTIGLRVVKVDPDRNLLLVEGAVPGPKGSLVMVRETVKARKNGKKQ